MRDAQSFSQQFGKEHTDFFMLIPTPILLTFPSSPGSTRLGEEAERKGTEDG